LAVCVLLLGGLPRMAAAQAATAESLAPRVGALVAELEHTFACDVAVLGEPRFDEFSRQWLVAYSVEGGDCDTLTRELKHRSTELGVTFYRRPNAAEVRGLIGNIRRSVELGFGCRISLKGEPRLDEQSDLWSVTYLASGRSCAAAEDEIQRQGRELRIFFLRMETR
jgi:hypothetical protein